MANYRANQHSLISDSLHPLVNMAIMGLVLMFVTSVWMFFDSDRYQVLLNVVITGLFTVAIAIPAILWLTWRRNAEGPRNNDHLDFRDWAAGEFETWTDSVKGMNAAAEVLLPIAAVAIGMAVLGLTFRIIAGGAG